MLINATVMFLKLKALLIRALHHTFPDFQRQVLLGDSQEYRDEETRPMTPQGTPR